MANGFLNVTPEQLLSQLQQQQMVLEEQRRQQRASNKMTHGAASAGNLLGVGIAKLFGLESSPTDNPEYQKALKVRDIATSVPQDDPEKYYSEVGRRFADAGLANEAHMALKKLNEYRSAQAEAAREEREIGVKEKNADTNAGRLRRQEEWDNKYITYLYDALKNSRANSAASDKLKGYKLKMWESKTGQVAAKDWAKGQKDPESSWYGIPKDVFREMDVYEKMGMLSEKGIEDIGGFVYNDEWLQRLIVGGGALNQDSGTTNEPITPAGTGGKDYFADIPD